MLGRNVGEEIRREHPEELWAPEVRAVCGTCDTVVLNLECCVSARGERTALIAGKSFFFRAPPVAVEALTAVGVGAVSLANNHALDYGPAALMDTLDHLDAARIAHAGAGGERGSARSGAVVEAGELRLGVLAVSDHPREYAAGRASPGIAWADLRTGLPLWVRQELERLRNEADAVLAFPHWGPNMVDHPAAWQRERGRELLEAGADAVAGHSAHLFHGVGFVNGRPLLYDLGDALDDYAVDPVLRNDLGVLAIWRPAGDPVLELVGLELEYCRTVLARGEAAGWIAARLERACSELGTHVERLAEQRFSVAG